jgi:hypothetical protein
VFHPASFGVLPLSKTVEEAHLSTGDENRLATIEARPAMR